MPRYIRRLIIRGISIRFERTKIYSNFAIRIALYADGYISENIKDQPVGRLIYLISMLMVFPGGMVKV